MKNNAAILFCTAIALFTFFTGSPVSANEKAAAKTITETHAALPEGTWYLAAGSQIIRFDFKSSALLVSGRDLMSESEVYVPYQKMELSPVSDTQIELNVTAVAMPSVKDGSFLNREEFCNMMVEERALDRERAAAFGDEMFSTVILSYALHEDGTLWLKKEGQDGDLLLPAPPMVNPSLKVYR